MKKVSLIVMLVSAFGFCSALAGGIPDPVTAKKVFAITGEFQVYVGFPFVVPTGECNNLDVYRWEKGFEFYRRPAVWFQINPGEITGAGYYRFVNREMLCNPKFEIRGELDQTANMSGWSALEIEPREVGIFAKNVWQEVNPLGLSEDDTQYSYYLVSQGHGMKTSLDFVLHEQYFASISGEPVGVIVADSRGALKKVFMPRHVNDDSMGKIIFDDDDIIVVIYKESY